MTDFSGYTEIHVMTAWRRGTACFGQESLSTKTNYDSSYKLLGDGTRSDPWPCPGGMSVFRG